MTNVGAEYLTTLAKGHLIVENFQVYLIVNFILLKSKASGMHHSIPWLKILWCSITGNTLYYIFSPAAVYICICANYIMSQTTPFMAM